MKRIIIFDFNRTLYDPESRALFPSAKETLEALQGKGFDLFMITYQEGARESDMKKLGIWPYFNEVIFTQEKNKADFERILQKTEADIKRSFVVGDRARKEIAFGNLLGFQTIWVRKGKFQDELPEQSFEHPTYIVHELNEVLALV